MTKLKHNPALYFWLFSFILIAPNAWSQKPRAEIKQHRSTAIDFNLKLDIISSGFDGISCWFHPRAGIIPDRTSQAPTATSCELFYHKRRKQSVVLHLESGGYRCNVRYVLYRVTSRTYCAIWG